MGCTSSKSESIVDPKVQAPEARLKSESNSLPSVKKSNASIKDKDETNNDQEKTEEHVNDQNIDEIQPVQVTN